jgi:hypothetical protein
MDLDFTPLLIALAVMGFIAGCLVGGLVLWLI